MWFFQKKTVEESKDEAILRLNARVFKVESEIMMLAAAQDDIRNKILKKVRFKPEEDIDEKVEKPKNLYSEMLLPE